MLNICEQKWIISSLTVYSFILQFSPLLIHVLVNDVRATADLETVEVTEGETITLNSHITGVKSDDGILWTFGTRNIRIAQIFKMEPFTHYDEIFRNRLQLDTQTGSLTIHNISITHSGVYKLQIISNDVSTKQFNVTVYARLPVPNITRASHSKRKSSISLTCPVLCSVDSVNKVTLSWYKGNHVISTISDSKTSSLFLPLEVEYHDKNTYSCVASNPVSNQTALLIITSICQPVSGHRLILLSVIPAVALLLVVILVLYWKFRKVKKNT
ncbi:SLAM family member 5-like [Electrophorus electricus]|uniref:SLAM family member 5-like n=1 Tax=Electrophorus electricus TaxID=8005 RepID=UPI0015CFF28A|nr:SLAM family member 5-like [Electrophorus electricus]